MSALAKPAPGTLKKERAKRKRSRKAHELEQMKAVHERDVTCRFPGCGCRYHNRPKQCAHIHHRGMGGNPSGDRTLQQLMILLCVDRHQDGVLSLDRGTLRCEPLTDRGTDGPVEWSLRVEHGGEWIVLATESAPHVLLPLTDTQSDLLTQMRASFR